VHGLTAEDPFPWLDQSGLAALLAGSFVVLIKFFTSYSHVDFPANASIAVNQQNGIPLFLAALAALVGEVKLASNNRCADQRDRNLYLVIDVWSREAIAGSHAGKPAGGAGAAQILL
jgi:hypothetical protein